jgi:MFS family permease
MANLDLFVVNVTLPDIGRAFHGASLNYLSWVLNAYAIVFAALLVIAGRLFDRHGHRPGFLLGMVVFTCSSALCAVATDVGWLVGARILQAVGAAVLLPTSLALLLATAPPERRGRVVRTWSAVAGVAAAPHPPRCPGCLPPRLV